MMTPFVLIHRQLVLRIDVPFEKLHELLAENIIFLPHVQKHNYLIQSHIVVFSEVKSQTRAPLFHFVTDCADICEIVYFNVLMLDFVARFLDLFDFHKLTLLAFMVVFSFENQLMSNVKEQVLLGKYFTVEPISIRIVGNLIFWWDKIRRKWEMLLGYIINHSFCLAHMNVVYDEIAHILINKMIKWFQKFLLKMDYWSLLKISGSMSLFN